ncbi:uncharacterized protein LOC131937953 [Physella acuta]|uniref:uncharacterized protein LOC131937953 n=1 Tax=Physella acuta TaxID=109671 RepID=UPI0027DC6F5C|nr:uncharacterized protein LOC131937953 [Physella acuta]
MELLTPVCLALLVTFTLAKSLDKRAAGCNVNGLSVADGATFTYPGGSKCITYKCNNGGYAPTTTACEFKGQCYAINSKFNDGCFTYGCQAVTENGSTILKTDIVTSRCKDSKGVCRNNGEVFPEVFGGQTFQCTCTVIGRSTSTSCK